MLGYKSCIFNNTSDMLNSIDYRYVRVDIRLGVLVSARTSEFRISYRRFIWVESKFRKRELQKCSFEWAVDVGMW